ncbi:MAG: GNAT family N-acetyltransferase [Firmicutes bacterium]|nr:GNAT family N-acetyltransferase [Bacillota bacterium]
MSKFMIIIYPDSSNPNPHGLLDESLINQMYDLSDFVMSAIIPFRESAEEGYRRWREGYERNIASGAKYILLLRDGILSGFLVFTCNYGGRDEIFINDLIIHPKHQGDGATLRNLVYHFLREISDQAIPMIAVYVNEDNHRTQNLLRKAGFQVERRTENGMRYCMLRRQFLERFDFLLERGGRVYS